MPADELRKGEGSDAQQKRQGTLGAKLNVDSGLTGVASNSASQTTEDRVSPGGEGVKTGFGTGHKGKSLEGPGKVENTDKPY